MEKPIIIIFLLIIISACLAQIPGIIFSFKTLRRLRKNGETVYIIGSPNSFRLDMFHKATLFVFPRNFIRKYFCDEIDILYHYTSPFERVLARLYWWPTLFLFLALLMMAFVRP